MAIGPTFEKGEPTEADLYHAYEKARSIGLFIMEQLARKELQAKPHLREFVLDEDEVWGFTERGKMYMQAWPHGPLYNFIKNWGGVLGLTKEPMRFTADGPVRREW
jgi:hypothetical protein